MINAWGTQESIGILHPHRGYTSTLQVEFFRASTLQPFKSSSICLCYCVLSVDATRLKTSPPKKAWTSFSISSLTMLLHDNFWCRGSTFTSLHRLWPGRSFLYTSFCIWSPSCRVRVGNRFPVSKSSECFCNHSLFVWAMFIFWHKCDLKYLTMAIC